MWDERITAPICLILKKMRMVYASKLDSSSNKLSIL